MPYQQRGYYGAPSGGCIKSIIDRRMKSRRILYISQEIFPYLPESDIATTARQLPPVSYTHLTLPTTPYV